MLEKNLVLILDIILSFKVNNVCTSAAKRMKKKRVPKMDFEFEKRNEQTNRENEAATKQHHKRIELDQKRKTCNKKTQANKHSLNHPPTHPNEYQKEIERREKLSMSICAWQEYIFKPARG